MSKPPSHRPTKDPRLAAEALFKPAKPPLPQAATPTTLPGVKESVTLRLDQDVLHHFQAEGPGWQDRINAFLRKALAG
jgi:uncharacterized protein (DUF4415 family)